MLDASLTRKITVPTLPSVMLHRHALIAQLQEAFASQITAGRRASRYRLVLCCAPAGYGKTTLLADFACSTPLPCCWYFLDHTDADPVVFLRTLLTSVRQIFPSFGVVLDPLFTSLSSHQQDEEMKHYYAALHALCKALNGEIAEPLILIISNYEEIAEDEKITTLVNALLTMLPPHVALLIESRIIPDLAFTPLILRDELRGLSRESLRFSTQDIIELSRLQGGEVLTAAEAEELATSFDGWIAGILLGTRVGQARFRMLTRQVASPLDLQGNAWKEQQRQMLFSYIMDEVLKQDMITASFVQAISILQQIEPAMCDTLLNISDAAERLERLERQGPFLRAQENASGLIYTSHPVMRHLLSEHVQKREPERFRALHRQAAELWRARQNYEQAMYHALTIGADDLASSILLEHADYLLQHGQYETVMRWLYALPSEAQERSSGLLLLQATLLLRQGQHAAAFPLLDRAEALPTISQEANPHSFQARIDLLRSQALFQVGAYHQAQELCQHILLSVSERDVALCAAATLRLGICTCLQGDLPAGMIHLHKALALWAHQPPPAQAIEIHQALANAYNLTGNFSLALHHLARVFAACEQVPDYVAKGYALLSQGLIAQNQGKMTEAEGAFLQALDLARTVTLTQRGETHALGNLASLAVEQGAYMQALVYTEQCLALARTIGNRGVASDALVSRALSYLFLGDPASALLTIEAMDIPEGHVGYEHAWRELTAGLILLTQQRLSEATLRLEKIEAALSASAFKRECLEAKLRLAACRIAQEQGEQALLLLQEVATLLTAHSAYTHLVYIELQRLSALCPVVQTHPQLSALRALLAIAEPVEPTDEQLLLSLPRAESHSARLFIIAFGEPQVLLDGQPVKRWRMARAMELFFFLLAADHPLSKDAILAALWPDDDEQAMRSFHDTIYQLRKLFGVASLVHHQKAYHLDLAACYGKGVFYDVQTFQQAHLEAAQALSLQELTRAKEALLKMVQCYRGEYGRAFYHEWCSFRRDELRAHYLEARRQLAHLFWSEEDWKESAEHWQQMLRLDTCLEEAHLGLMRCYLKQGKRGAALRQYQTCQIALEEEFGAHPGPSLQHLYQRLIGSSAAE